MSRRTIERDLIALEAGLRVPLFKDGHRYRLMDTFQLPTLRLNLYEAAALFLAARLVG